jgi:hypothetical protein
MNYSTQVPTPLAVRSKTWVCGRTIAGSAGLNPAEGLDARLLCLWCACATRWSLVQCRVCVCVCVCVCVVLVCDVETSERDHLGPIWAVASQEREVARMCVFIYRTYVGGLIGT